MAKTKQVWVNLLEEYLSVIKKNQVYHCKEDSQLGFNIKSYSYENEDTLIQTYKEKYSDSKEIIEGIEEFRTKNLDEYSLLYLYQEDAWEYAKEYFVDMCAIEPEGYILKNYRSYSLIKTKKLAIELEKKNEKFRRAFSKIKNLYSAGRMSGYVIFDYGFYMSINEIENALYDLNNGITMNEFNDHYGLVIKDIKDDMEDIKLIAEEVKSFKEGHVKGWLEEVENRLDEHLEDYIPEGRQTMLQMEENISNALRRAKNYISSEKWSAIKAKKGIDIVKSLEESLKAVRELINEDYKNGYSVQFKEV